MTNKEQLNKLIPNYSMNKTELDSYKKLCDRDNAIIKELMKEEDIQLYDCGTHTAKMSVQTRQSMDENKLLDTIKSLNRPDLIKTKEYVDMDLLEKAIYNEEINASDLNNCMITKEVTTLKVIINKR